jgi:hypothetical protein
VHPVIKEHEPVPAVALTAVDAANTHIPSDPAELHAVLLVYV